MFTISFKTAATILFLVAGVAVILFALIAALSRVVVRFIGRKRAVEHKYKQKDLDATIKKLTKMMETLSPTICEMAKNSVPVEFLPDLNRSVAGTSTSQDDQLANFSMEALKALSSSLKPKG